MLSSLLKAACEMITSGLPKLNFCNWCKNEVNDKIDSSFDNMPTKHSSNDALNLFKVLKHGSQLTMQLIMFK